MVMMRSKSAASVPPRPPQRPTQFKGSSHNPLFPPPIPSTVIANTPSGGSDQRSIEAQSHGDGDGGSGHDHEHHNNKQNPGDGDRDKDGGSGHGRRKWRRIPRETILKSLRGEIHACEDRKVNIINPDPNPIASTQESLTGKNGNPYPTSNPTASTQSIFTGRKENPNTIVSTHPFFTGKKENPNSILSSAHTVFLGKKGNPNPKPIAVKHAVFPGKKKNLKPNPVAAAQKSLTSRKESINANANSNVTQKIFTGKKEIPNLKSAGSTMFTEKKESPKLNPQLSSTGSSLISATAEEIFTGKKENSSPNPAATKIAFESKKSRYPRDSENDNLEETAAPTQPLSISKETLDLQVKPIETLTRVKEAFRGSPLEKSPSQDSCCVIDQTLTPTSTFCDRDQILTQNLSASTFDRDQTVTLIPSSCERDKTLTLSFDKENALKAHLVKYQNITVSPSSLERHQTLTLTLTPSHCKSDQSLTLTPPPEKSLNSTSPAESKQTPPMQSTQSPDFVKREGMRALLPIDAENCCYAVAPCGLVKDRRKCKPRGVLTVDGMMMVEDAPQMSLGFDNNDDDGDCGASVGASDDGDGDGDGDDDMLAQTKLLPTPAVASVEWMLEGHKNLSTANSCADLSSQCFQSAESNDLCRMSFPRMSPPQFQTLPTASVNSPRMSQFQVSSPLQVYDQENRPNSLPNVHDNVEPKARKEWHAPHASISVSGYEWSASLSASSSQGTMVHSSCRSEISSGNPRRSIVFTEEGSFSPPRFKSNVVDNALFNDSIVDENDEPCSGFSEDESGEEDLLLQEEMDASLERSPPFEYSVMKSLKHKEVIKVGNEDDVGDDYGGKSSWAKCLREEVSVSISGPLNSSFLSSLDQELGNETSRCPAEQTLVCFRGETNALRREQKPLDIAAELLYNAASAGGQGGDITSRIAMARFLCNITATYLDDIASCLVKGQGEEDMDLGRITNESVEFHGLRNEHSSMLAGTKKMAECCSLLQDLSLGASKARNARGLPSECNLLLQQKDETNDIL